MKIACVTGASSGIGKASALRLREAGFFVLAGVRKPQDLAFWKDTPQTAGVLLDVASPASVAGAIESVRALLDQATVVHLVNNAGTAVAGPIEAVPLARWREQFEINVFGLVQVTQAFLPWIRSTQGRIVNLSSVSGLATNPYLGPYSASKYAVEAISDALRRELLRLGVKVIAVEPGPIATPIWEKNLAPKNSTPSDLLSPELLAVYGTELEKFLAMVHIAARKAAPVEKVTEAIYRALTLPNPRPRYIVGARGLPLLMRISALLPAAWMDHLIAREFRRFRLRK